MYSLPMHSDCLVDPVLRVRLPLGQAWQLTTASSSLYEFNGHGLHFLSKVLW